MRVKRCGKPVCYLPNCTGVILGNPAARGCTWVVSIRESYNLRRIIRVSNPNKLSLRISCHSQGYCSRHGRFNFFYVNNSMCAGLIWCRCRSLCRRCSFSFRGGGCCLSSTCLNRYRNDGGSLVIVCCIGMNSYGLWRTWINMKAPCCFSCNAVFAMAFGVYDFIINSGKNIVCAYGS
jgi:hypothetical protein